MTSILAGHVAPSFSLRGLNGRLFSLEDALRKGPVVAAFFKVTCPTCQFAFPFLERLHKAYAGDGVTFWGISQDDARDTREFCAEYGVTFPSLLDDEDYPVSNLYGLTNVPTIFLIDAGGAVKVSCVGFSRADFEAIAAHLAARDGRAPTPLFRASEIIPASKAG